MTILGTCLLYMVFPPVDGIFAVKVRVVEQLPLGLILGTSFMRRYESSLIFEGPGSGWFKPTPTAARVPLLPWMERPRDKDGTRAMEIDDVREASQEKDGQAMWMLDDQEWTVSLDEDQQSQPSEVMALDALELGTTAWTDGGTLKWEMSVDRNVTIPGGVSVEIDAHVTGAMPSSKTLVVVFPVSSLDLEKKVTLGISKGVQWWIPGKRLKIKVDNRAHSSSTLHKGMIVATAFAVNSDDVERMVLLKEPLPEHSPEELKEEYPVIEPRAPAPAPMPGEPQEEPEDPGADFTEAKMGQLGPRSRERVLEVLRECKAFFPANTKVVNLIAGREVALPLYDEKTKPFACKAQRFSPHMSDLLMEQINRMLEAGILRFATSEWCARIVLVLKKDGTYRIALDYRELNKLLEKNVGGLGDIVGMLDRMKGCKYFSSIDLRSAFHQLPLKESDKHKTAFRDPTGRLLEWNVASFGITTIPAVFSSTLGDDLREILGHGAEKWLDDIVLYTLTFDEHVALLAKVLRILISRNYTGHFGKSEFCLPEIEFLGVMVGRDGVRPAPSKIKAVQELELPTTVGEVRSFLGLAGYLRGFVPNFSGITAPISDLLRNKEFSSKRARNKPVPWGPQQTTAFLEIIERLTTHPVLVLPDWSQPFTLHTDASIMALGAVLTQAVDEGKRHGPVGYHSKRLSRAQQKASANDREVLAVLYSVDHFEIYLQHRQFTLITDCAALLWLFTSQNLTAKMHRWALKLMAYDMVLKWRRGTEHLVPDALSRLRRRSPEKPDIDTTALEDVDDVEPRKGPAGPVLEGVPLQQLAPQLEEEEQPQPGSLAEAPPELARLMATPRDELVLDGICLADLGPTEVDDRGEENIAVFYAIQLTPERLEPSDEGWLMAQEEVQQFFTSRKPRAVVLGRGAGGTLQAVTETLEVTHVIDPDWMTFECINANGGPGEATLIRQPLELKVCQKVLSEAKPEILLGNACCKVDDPGGGGAAARNANAIVQIFVSTRAQILVMEAPVRFAGTDIWNNTLKPQLQMAGCETETATLKATAVGLPTTKQRVFVVAVKRYGDDRLRPKLQRWKKNMERPAPAIPTVGAFLDREGSFFLKRGRDVKEIFSFSEPTVTITQEQIMARKPSAESFTPHANDKGTLETTQELSWEDYVKLTTTRDSFSIPPTLRRRDVARVLEECSPPPMLREALSLLQLRGRERRQMEVFGEEAQGGDDTLVREDELLIGLASMQLEETTAAMVTREKTQAAGLTSFDRSRFKVIPRETRHAAAVRKERETREAQATKPQTEEVPPPLPTASSSSPEGTQPPSVSPQQLPVEAPALKHPAPPASRKDSSPQTPTPEPATATPSTDVPMPDVESQTQAPSMDMEEEEAIEEEDPGPTVSRSHSQQLERMENILRDHARLASAQQEDLLLGPIRKALEQGKGETGDYVLDDQNLLFHAPRGKLHAIALPRKLIPGVLALAHGTFVHPGRARTTLIIADKYHWPTLKEDVNRYVRSCRCRMRKRQWSAQLHMLPARFLRAWEVLELDILDMKVVSNKGNRYLLVVVDRATKFLSASPLPTKGTLGVSRKLLELILIFGLPLSIRCDPGGENTSEIMEHLCRWLKVSLDFGPTNHPRGQGTVERMGAVLSQLLSELCQAWPERWDEYVSIATWAHRMLPDESLPGNLSPYQMLFGRAPRTPLDQLAPSLDNSALGLEPTVEETRRKHLEVTKALQQRQAGKNRHRDRRNAQISRTSPGAKAIVGDKVLVRESASTLYRDGVHPKLAHDHFTGPWVVVNVVRVGLSFTVRLHGRHVRQRTVAASDIKRFYSRPLDLRLPFEDEFSHFVWGPDLGLVAESVVAAPLYTLTDRKAVQGAGGASTAWAWGTEVSTKMARLLPGSPRTQRGTASHPCSWTCSTPCGRITMGRKLHLDQPGRQPGENERWPREKTL